MATYYPLFSMRRSNLVKFRSYQPSSVAVLYQQLVKKYDFMNAAIEKINTDHSRDLYNDMDDLANGAPAVIRELFRQKTIKYLLDEVLPEFMRNHDAGKYKTLPEFSDSVALTLTLWISSTWHFYWLYYMAGRDLLVTGMSRDLPNLDLMTSGVDNSTINMFAPIADLTQLNWMDILNNPRLVSQSDTIYLLTLARRILMAEVG